MGVLQLSYEKGGLQLVDINSKIKTQRVNHILYLMSIKDDNIGRFLVDSLVGKDNKYGQNGLGFGLITNLERIKEIKNDFYKRALKLVNSTDLILKPGNIRSIYDEPLFYNKLILERNNETFTLTRHKRIMPKKVKDLQTHTYHREPEIVETIQRLRTSINNIDFANKSENEYHIKIDNKLCDIRNLPFKNIYLKYLKDKHEIREWEDKWANILNRNDLEWTNIWKRVLDEINSPHVQSSIWETIHLNFWSGYKAGEECKLCREVERDTSHITNECCVLREILKEFRIHNKFNDNFKISFGLENERFHNYILFHIKSVVFRARFQTFTSKDLCTSRLINKCKARIREDIQNRYNLAKLLGKLDNFSSNFVVDNEAFSLCVLNEAQDLIIRF